MHFDLHPQAEGQQTACTPGEEVFADLTGNWQDVEPLEGTRILAQRYPTFDSARDSKCAATIAKSGAGMVAAIHGPAGAAFAATHAAAIRELVRRAVAEIFAPAVEVNGPPTVEVSLRRKGGRLLVHLNNCTAMRVAADYATVDFIPEVGPLQVAIRLAKAPRSVTFEPDGKKLAGEWKNASGAERWTGSRSTASSP